MRMCWELQTVLLVETGVYTLKVKLVMYHCHAHADVGHHCTLIFVVRVHEAMIVLL